MKKVTKVSQVSGNEVRYYNGGRERTISTAHLKDIRSRIVTHEGEVLSGKKGRAYLDKHSQECLGKNMRGVYKDESIQGKV